MITNQDAQMIVSKSEDMGAKYLAAYLDKLQLKAKTIKCLNPVCNQIGFSLRYSPWKSEIPYNKHYFRCDTCHCSFKVAKRKARFTFNSLDDIKIPDYIAEEQYVSYGSVQMLITKNELVVNDWSEDYKNERTIETNTPANYKSLCKQYLDPRLSFYRGE